MYKAQNYSNKLSETALWNWRKFKVNFRIRIGAIQLDCLSFKKSKPKIKTLVDKNHLLLAGVQSFATRVVDLFK